MISEFCIRRPVATLLMSFALILGGLFAYKFLPVAALPQAEFPVINVSASLPGASPQTMATSVATPLIKQFATIAGIDSISTTNALGTTSIVIQFDLTRDIDAAAAEENRSLRRCCNVPVKNLHNKTVSTERRLQRRAGDGSTLTEHSRRCGRC